MENVTGVVIMTFLETLQVLVLIILIIWYWSSKKKKEVLVLGEGANDDINGSTGAPEKNSINFSNIRNFAKVCITMVIRVTCE